MTVAGLLFLIAYYTYTPSLHSPLQFNLCNKAFGKMNEVIRESRLVTQSHALRNQDSLGSKSVSTLCACSHHASSQRLSSAVISEFPCHYL